MAAVLDFDLDWSTLKGVLLIQAHRDLAEICNLVVTYLFLISMCATHIKRRKLQMLFEARNN